ncbi:MAG: hypothetical protein IPJ88_06700 [Myxococcales bacterium]|nr:MAG: hypothetical protein IPJ88_06700 [Myxococcales bacterium]
MMRLMVWIVTFALIFFVWRVTFALLGRIFSLIPPWGWGVLALLAGLWWTKRRRAHRAIRVKSTIHDLHGSKTAGNSSGAVIDAEGRVISEHTSSA